MQKTNPQTSTKKQVSRWHAFDSQDAINQATLKQVLSLAAKAIKQNGSFSIVLAGGTTPKSVYELLRNADTDWSKWHVYYNDDRCLPADHPDRNSLMAAEVWLNHVSIPANQIYPIPTELGPKPAAEAYREILSTLGNDFDLVLLGLGEDGHTASLFPGQTWDDSLDAFAVYEAPKPPPERVSISASRLSRAKEVIFLVTGAGKQEAVDNWRNGAAIPASLITPDNGVDVYYFGVKVAG